MAWLQTMIEDARAHGDRRSKMPAPRLLMRALLFSQGFQLLTLWRVSSWMHRRNTVLRLLSKPIIALQAFAFGCYLNPHARLGMGLCFPHPVGVVIGEGVRIGPGATIYQNVTLGIARLGTTAYPQIGDRVVVYAGAVLAGAVVLGDDVNVGANSVVLRSVPSGQTVVGNPGRIVQKRNPS